jgi:hypothetical protein
VTGILAIFVGGAEAIGADCFNVSVFGTRVLPDSNNASAFFEVRSTGVAASSTNGSAPSILGTWLLQGAASDYEIRVTGTGDSPGTLNTWLNLGTTRSWSLTQTGGVSGSKSFSGTWEIRRASSGVIQDSANFLLEVEVTI